MEGIVIRSTGRWYEVHSDHITYRCVLKGKIRLRGLKTTNPVAVGDRVLFDYVASEELGQITAIQDRKNVIIRRSTNLSKQTHILASNIDLAIIVATPILPRTSTGFMDRFLISAESYHIPVLIVFNKLDLFESDMELVEYYEEVYHMAGYETLCVSAQRGDNIEKLKSYIAGKTILLAGHSGVGKSALINAISPELHIKTGKISSAHLKGTHTTTFATMHFTDDGTLLIDTPGIKEFGVVDFEPWELGHWFPEFKAFIPHCRYANCTHQHEPGCAVIEAVDQNKIHVERYNNYLGILSNISG